VDEQLKIKIGADVTDGVQGLKRFEQELAQTGKVAATTSQITQASFSKIQAGSAQAATRASKDFTGLSRVVQDLPFGFIAISNNLEQLIPAAAGAGLAFSGLIAVLSFAQIGFANWTRGVGLSSETLGDNVKKIHEARQALDTYVESLNDVTKAQIVGQQNAQEELVNLKTLYTATQNVNIPLAERKKLVDQLQEQYPKYFGNIKDEIILAGGAKNAYDKLTASILAVAHAEAAKSALVDLGKQDIAVGQEQVDNNQELFDIQKKINALKASGAKITSISLSGEERLTSEGAKLNKLQNQYNDIVAKGTDLQKNRIDLFNRQKRLTEEITDITVKNPEALLDPGGKTPKGDKGEFGFLFDFLPFDPNGKLKPDQQRKLEEATKKFSANFKNILEGIEVDGKLINLPKTLEEGLDFNKALGKGLPKFKMPPIDVEAEMKIVPKGLRN
jgi:hypothetical protein